MSRTVSVGGDAGSQEGAVFRAPAARAVAEGVVQR